MKTIEQTPKQKPKSIPYTISLGDGRTLFVSLPAHLVTYDRSGELCFTPDGVDHLDQIRALAVAIPAKPSPGYILTLRKALGLTQEQLANKLELSTIAIKRWESGSLHPGAASLKKLMRLVEQATRKGVVLG